jgi:radical SAM-linked protein
VRPELARSSAAIDTHDDPGSYRARDVADTSRQAIRTVDDDTIVAGREPRDTVGEGQAEEWLGTPRQALEPSWVPAAGGLRATYRLTYQKVDRARFLGNRELVTAFVRTCRRADVPVAFSAGHHPLPRMSFGPAMPLGYASLGEFMDLELTAVWPEHELVAALNGALPEGLVVLEAETLVRGSPTLAAALQGFSYSVSLAGLPRGRVSNATVVERTAVFAQARTYFIQKRVKGVERSIDARAAFSLTAMERGTVHVDAVLTSGATLKPHHVVAEVLGLSDLESRLLQVTKVATVLAHPAPVGLGDRAPVSAA